MHEEARVYRVFEDAECASVSQSSGPGAADTAAPLSPPVPLDDYRLPARNYTVPVLTVAEQNVLENALALLSKKGVYPYTFMQSHSCYDINSLPPIEAFYNDLSQKPCSASDYEQACNVWRYFKCRTMLDYTKLYLLTGKLFASFF